MDARKKAMVEAMHSQMGIVTSASEKSGIPRRTHYAWMKDDPEYAAAIKEVDNTAFDFVEGKMFKHIQEGDANMVRFYMKYKGKHKDYIPASSSDINHTGEITQKHIVEMGNRFIDEINKE